MKNGFNNITKENKKILKQKKVNLKSKLYLFLLIISLVNPISENNSRYLNTYSSEIRLVIKGKGIISFLNQNFYSKLSKVSINREERNTMGQTSFLFRGETNTIELEFKEQIKTCNGMFYKLENITEIDLSNFDASKVTDMSGMFCRCSNLEKVEFGNIITSSLENMFALFELCPKITSVDLSHFDTSKVTDMSSMFNQCSDLDNITFGNINTSSLVYMTRSFQGCSKITSIDLSNLVLSKVKDMSYMFNGCSNLEKIEFGNIAISSIENVVQLFYGCSKLMSLNLSSFAFSKVKNMFLMFSGCSNLEKIDFGKINTSSLENMCALFQGCSSLTSIDLSNFDTSNVKDMSFMFNLCSNLKHVEFENLNTSSLENMARLFFRCSHLVSIDLSNFDTSKVTDMSYLFYGCSNLKHINLSNFKAENLNLMDNMFFGCSSLIYLNLYSLNLDNSKNIDIQLTGFSPNIKYCIYDTETKNNLLGPDIISICSDTCIDEKNIKIDINNNQCIDLCINSNNKYDFNNICYERCPKGKKLNNFSCIENECNGIQNSKNCFNSIPKGYYLDLTDEIYKQCFENCDYCNGPGNETINNCVKCKNNFIFLNDSLYESNCYEHCIYFYYFDESNKYHCTDNGICPEKFKKFIKNKNKCTDKCKRDSLYSYDLNNSCVEKCPNETSILMNDDEYYCVKNIPKEYYFDSIYGIYIKCYKTCGECYGKGDELNNNCIQCKSNYSFHDNLLNISNCYENCEFYHYFDESNNYHCTETEICPKNYSKLIIKQKRCIDQCKNETNYKYEFENKCYLNCPNGTILDENRKTCIINITYKDERDKRIKNFREYIQEFNISENDIIAYEKEMIYQISTTHNQNNNTNKNVSTIDLGDCEKILKKEYKINDTLPLIIFKIDYFPPDTLIPIIGYEIYHPITKSKLDLKYCRDILIKLNIPVDIDENNLFKYDPYNDYYTDNCFPYTTDNGTDIILNDRKQEFTENNLSLCENNCTYKGYNSSNNHSTCSCTIKNKMDLISEIMDNPNKLSNIFLTESNAGSGTSSNIVTIKCTKTLFSKDGLKNNISSYIIIIFIMQNLLCIILFIKCGYPLLESDIKNILDEKEKIEKQNNHKKSNLLVNQPKNKIINKKRKAHFPPKKGTINFINNFNQFKNNNNIINYRKPKKKNIINKNKNKKKINSTNISLQQKKDIIKAKKFKSFIVKYNDYELNTMEYRKALLYDKRSFCQYYLVLLKRKNLILFSICPVKDYNTMIIKLCIFSLSFSIYYVVNFAFFTENIIHKIYEIGGKYDLSFFMPKILISFAISYFISNIIKLIFLSERNIMKVKEQPTLSIAYDFSTKVKRQLIIKYIIFFIISLIFLVFFWMLLSTFGAVYQNTQLFIFKNALISFSISLIYPFFINILPCIFRIASLNSEKKDNECMFNLSKFLQIL